jgi:hypothetical protein
LFIVKAFSFQLSASQCFFSIVDPLPAIAHGNPFQQHSAAFFDVPPYMPLGEIPGEAGGLEIFELILCTTLLTELVSVHIELPAYLIQCVSS